MAKWLVAGVSRIYCPGTKFDYVPILSGKTGLGKSTFFNKLGRAIWFTDSLNKFDDKTALEVMSGKLILEFGELSKLKKADVEEIKTFITKTEFNARLAFDARATRRLIQWIYCGSTNDDTFLKDKTGNRRFWPVDVYTDKPKLKNVFVDLEPEVGQIWAEAIQMYKDEFQIYPTKEEELLAAAQQETHMESDELELLLEDRLVWNAPKEEWEPYTFTEIIVGLNLSDRLKSYARQHLKAILSKRGVIQERTNIRRYYTLPPRDSLKEIKDYKDNQVTK